MMSNKSPQFGETAAITTETSWATENPFWDDPDKSASK